MYLSEEFSEEHECYALVIFLELKPDDLARILFTQSKDYNAVAYKLFMKWFNQRKFKQNKTSSKEKWEKLKRILVYQLGRDDLNDKMDNALESILVLNPAAKLETGGKL